jgi:two-component system OmpR family sensor kinase
MRLFQRTKEQKTSSTLLRLTLWHVAVLALFMAVLSYVIYALLSRNFYGKSDAVLTSIEDATVAILQHGLSESGLDELAARDAVRILSFSGYTLSIYDSYGNLLAEKPIGISEEFAVPGVASLADGEVHLYTVKAKDKTGLRRVAVVHITLQPVGRTYIVVASRSLDSLLVQLKTGRRILLVGVPIGLLLAGLAGWFLVRKSFAPVLAMSEHALRISAENIDQRFPVSDSPDELGRLANTFNDLLSRLSTSFHLQKHFMADASHELRTPLSIICSTAAITLQLDKPKEDEDYRHSLGVIQEEGRRLSRVVEDMFCLARADSGGLVLQRTAFHLDELLLDTIRSVGWLATAKGIRIHIESLEEAPAQGDEDLLRRIFINLLTNAVKHTPAEGEVFVSLEKYEGEYRVSIRDTGKGIEAEYHGLIFQRFYRVNPGHSQEENRSDTTSGAGLGLPIARTIAEAHGGSLWLERSNREGSTFVCVLPIVLQVEQQLEMS